MYLPAERISRQGFLYKIESFMKLCYRQSAMVMLYFNNRYV